jgi:phosphopantothenoylcysteine decarboxylase/phosphopantothenate--cysteine ligase
VVERLDGKVVVLGITGSIAAYKGAEVARRLMDLGAEVHATLTRAGAQFITPLTLRTLTGQSVTVDMFEDASEWQVEHVSLAKRAAAVVIAPATADAIAKLALGIGDEFIYTVALATRAPIIVAPAMESNMLLHSATQEHMEALRGRGVHFVEPEAGRLASGATGVGRLASPEAIAQAVARILAPGDLAGLRVLITAGPTQEPVDAVRYISNRSSGKMGYALAAAAARRGAKVTLVSGPTTLADPAGCEVVRVETAAEMRAAVSRRFARCDALIAAAAVADFTPAKVSSGKVKKGSMPTAVELSRTVDIVAECGEKKKAGQVVVGFAAETQDLLENAGKKLKSKRLDLIVANDVSQPGVGFGSERNAGFLLFADGEARELPEMEKAAFAERVLDAVSEIKAKGGQRRGTR